MMNRPRVWLTVTLLFLCGVMMFVDSFEKLYWLNALRGVALERFGYIQAVMYLILLLGIVNFVSGGLIAAYRRVGLQIGLLGIVAQLAAVLVLMRSGGPHTTIFYFGILVVNLVLIYRLIRYLSGEPQKQAFT